MKLYFRNSKDQLRLIAECESEELCYDQIVGFLQDKNYKSYYSRIWINDDGITIVDVGSHSEFFEIHK